MDAISDIEVRAVRADQLFALSHRQDVFGLQDGPLVFAYGEARRIHLPARLVRSTHRDRGDPSEVRVNSVSAFLCLR